MEENDFIVNYIQGIISQYHIYLPQNSSTPIDLLSVCINFFIDSLRNTQKSYSSLSESYRIMDINYKQSISDIESKDLEIQSLTSKLYKLESQFFQFQHKTKQEKEKILKEKGQLKKENLKFSSLCTQYQHEIKKNELKYCKIKEQLRKTLEDKDLTYKNSAEICKLLSNKRNSSVQTRPGLEFSNFVNEGNLSCNKYSSDILLKLNDTVNKVFDCIKLALEGLGFELDWETLNWADQEMYASEVTKRLQGLEKYLKNVRKINDFADGDNIGVLKSVIAGYKEIFESQIIHLLKT